jgi:pimeloyl-ACP methyl ester carboxylesterase
MTRWIAIVAGVLVAMFLVAWLVVLPLMVLTAPRTPNEATPKALGVTYSDVRFATHDGTLMLSGWWMPAAQPKGIVIFVHGGGANRRDFYAGGLELQAFLQRQGYDVLSFDMRNHGASDGTPNGELTMGVEESNDARGAINFALERAPGLPVTLLGDSMGGSTSIFAAHDDPRVARLMLIDPVLDIYTTELGAVYASLGLPKLLIPGVLWSESTFFARPFAARSPLAEAEALRVPTLLIGDDRDPVCRPEFGRALAANNRHVTFWVSHDPDRDTGRWGYHVGAYRLAPKAVEATIAHFLERT